MKFQLLRSPGALACAAVLSLCAPRGVRAETKIYVATAPDRVALAIQETGNPDGTPIIFIHGLLGSSLDWTPSWAAPTWGASV